MISMSTILRENIEKIVSDYRAYEPDDHTARDLIFRAYEFAERAHAGQKRKS